MRKTTEAKSMKLIEELRFHREHQSFNDHGVIIDAFGVEYCGVLRNPHHINTALASHYGLFARIDKIDKIKLAMRLAFEEDQHERNTLYRTPEGDVFEVVEMSNISGLIVRDLSAECREQSSREMSLLGVTGVFAFAKLVLGRSDILREAASSTNPYGHHDLGGYRVSILTQPINSSLFAVPAAPRADVFVMMRALGENGVAFELTGWCTQEELLQHREQIDLGFQTIFAIPDQRLRGMDELASLLQSGPGFTQYDSQIQASIRGSD